MRRFLFSALFLLIVIFMFVFVSKYGSRFFQKRIEIINNSTFRISEKISTSFLEELDKNKVNKLLITIGEDNDEITNKQFSFTENGKKYFYSYSFSESNININIDINKNWIGNEDELNWVVARIFLAIIKQKNQYQFNNSDVVISTKNHTAHLGEVMSDEGIVSEEWSVVGAIL